MSIFSRSIPAGILFLVVAHLAGPASAQPQSRDQQRCITGLNAAFAKVAKTRSKALLRCAKAAQKGDSFDACLADQGAKLDKALAKLESTEGKKCSAAPDFGPTDIGEIGEAALELADTAITDLLGPSPAATLADKKQAKAAARCQLSLAKTAQKCALARVQAFNRCKKAGLKSGSIESAGALATCLDEDAGGRLAKTCAAKLERVAGRCAGIDTAAAFPACGASDAPATAQCADGRLACRARDALAAADRMDVPGCGSITPEPETALAATASLGPDGGEVSAVGGDGTVYRLSVPEGALLSEVAITITPVSAIPDLPLTGGLVAAVQFAPDGLQLWQPATLTIELAAAPDPGDLAGFGWASGGDDIHLTLVAVEGNTLTLGVTHFSGTGAAIIAPENLATLSALPPGSIEQQYLNQLPPTTETDPLAWVAWLSAWFDAGVKPLLEGAITSDETLLAGLDAFVAWKFAAESGAPAFLNVDPNFFLGLDDFALANRVDTGLALAAIALREGVVRNDIECLVEEDLAFAEAELRWQGIAAALGLATEANGLDLGTVMEDFCVEVVYESITYPQFPQAGVPATLVVSAGYAIDAGTTQFDQALTSTIDPTGTVEGANFLIIPSGDVGAIDYTPTGDEELALNLNTCLLTPEDYPVLDGKVCQPAIVVRGFEIAPEDATLEPGEEFDFDALLYGEPHPSVTWTATGGEITQSGVYTAGDIAGTFTVTATSNLSGLSESAVVTIGAGPPPGSLVVLETRTSTATATASATNEQDGDNGGGALTDFAPGIVEADAGITSPEGDSGLSSSSATFTRSFDANGDVESISSETEASASGLAVFTGGGGDARATTRVTFQVNEPVAYDLGWTHDLTGESGFGRVMILADGLVFFRRVIRPVPNPDEQVGEDTGVLTPGLYTVEAESRAVGFGTTSAGGSTTGAGSAEASFTLTLTPQ